MKQRRNFWAKLAGVIIRRRLLALALITLITVLLGTQWKYNTFSFSEANLMPEDHPVNIEYKDFLKKFGEEGNTIVVGIKAKDLHALESFNQWITLNKRIAAFPEIGYTISLENLSILEKDELQHKFVLMPLLKKQVSTKEDISAFFRKVFDMPLYEGLIYNKERNSIRSVIYMDKELVNTNVRRDFIINDLNPLIEKFERETGADVHVSGMPYIRTMNTEIIMGEIGLFIIGALFVTSLVFFLFYRSFRATFISIIVVVIGVSWGFGLLGLFRYNISILTALIPPLIIVIGIPNCIFLINRYQQEAKRHGSRVKSLQRVISKVGNVAFLTNLTTAIGFGTFIITKSSILKEFGIVASISIMSVFLLSIIVIPCFYSFLPIPKSRHLKHLDKRWVNIILTSIERVIRHYRPWVYVIAIVLVGVSTLGIRQINTSGSILDDIPKTETFAKDIRFFENDFQGIMPLEILIDTKHPKGAIKPSNLKRLDELEKHIDSINYASKPVSVTSLAKYLRQAYYNNNPRYYGLPTSRENIFIASYIKESKGYQQLTKNFVDSTGGIARVTTFIKNIDSKTMNSTEASIREKISHVFPKEKYVVSITGKSLVFFKGTDYLITNLIQSLILAIALIAIIMAYLFKSIKMVVVSVIPNLLPLLMTAGLMGYLGIPLKPSTILVFSIAFGISVDDTLHFLAKYGQELKSNLNISSTDAVYKALKDVGVSMFYTSVVLFLGFSVFMLSSYGGTIALGGLVSFTLLIAMFSNLILLPCLLTLFRK